MIEPVAVRVRTAARMLDIGVTKAYELLAAGKLEAVRIDADQRVLVSSIKRLASASKVSA
jgi:hypothetical protein